MNPLELSFMQRAIIIGLVLAAAIPCIGILCVLKRMSLMGDTLAHSSLAGVAFGFIFGFNPTLGAAAYCVLAAAAIEFLRHKFPQYADISLAIILSTGVGLAGVLSGYLPASANFSNFLFGSIVAVPDEEFYTSLGVGLATLGAFFLFYKEVFYIVFDEQGAKLAGVPVHRINFVFVILTAATIAVAARTVGALIVSSLMVLPVACALQIARSFRSTVWLSISFSVLFMISGLIISCYTYAKPGGAIALTGVAALVAILVVKAVVKR